MSRKGLCQPILSKVGQVVSDLVKICFLGSDKMPSFQGQQWLFHCHTESIKRWQGYVETNVYLWAQNCFVPVSRSNTTLRVSADATTIKGRNRPVGTGSQPYEKYTTSFLTRELFYHQILQKAPISACHSRPSLSWDSRPGHPASGICFSGLKKSCKNYYQKQTVLTWHSHEVWRRKGEIFFTSPTVFGNEKSESCENIPHCIWQ